MNREPSGPPVWPPPRTVATVRERLARLQRFGLAHPDARLIGGRADALLSDAVTQGRQAGRTDLGVIDASLELFLRHKRWWRPRP